MNELPIEGLLLRRAVLGTLLAAVLLNAGATTNPQLTKRPSRVIADLLAHQVRAGRVAKFGPALFAVVPDSMSRSTRRRCLHWRQELAKLKADVATWPRFHPRVSSPVSDATQATPVASERGEPRGINTSAPDERPAQSPLL